MALLRNIGRAMRPGFGTGGTLAAVGLGGALGVASSDPTSNSFDYATELLLGSPNADEAIMGTSMGWGNWLNPLHNPATAATLGGVGGTVLGGIIGGATRGVGGAVLGGLIGGTVGAIGNTASFMRPYINPTMIGDAFSEDKGVIAARRLAEKNVEAGWNLYDIPNSNYIRNSPRPRRMYDTGASGEMVFGMWNQRMG